MDVKVPKQTENTNLDVALAQDCPDNIVSDSDSDVYETAEQYSDSNDSYYSLDDLDDDTCSDNLDSKASFNDIHGIDNKKRGVTGQNSFVSHVDSDYEKFLKESLNINDKSAENDHNISNVMLTDQVSIVTEVAEQGLLERNTDFKSVDYLIIETNNNITDYAKTVHDDIQNQILEERSSDVRIVSNDTDTPLSELESKDVDIKELSFKEKLAYFEKIGFDTPKSSNKDSKRMCKVANNSIRSSDKKFSRNDSDSSDENDSMMAIETSYEDLLDSLLDSSQVENDSKEMSDNEDFGKSDTESSEQCLKGIKNLDYDLTESIKQIEDVKHTKIKSVDQALAKHFSKSDILRTRTSDVVEINEFNNANSISDSIVQVVELGVTKLNDQPHQNNLFCAKVVYAAAKTTDNVKQAKETLSLSNSHQNKTLLVPSKDGCQKENDNVINRQSSVIKENRLTRMPFADRSDSEILNDIGDFQEDNSKTISKSTDDFDNVVVRYVELGTASLLEGSHFKNLRHAKLVNPFISLRKTGLLERMTSGETSSFPAMPERVSSVKIRNKPIGDLLGVARPESIIVPEVCISVAASEAYTLPPSKSSDQVVKSPEAEDETKTKLNKSLRRKIGRHNAIVSDYVTNIERAESLRNSLNVEDYARGLSGEEDNLNLGEEDTVIRDRSGSFVKNKDKRQNEVVRTVEIGTACLYEIPHLKYLHCAKIVSPSS